MAFKPTPISTDKQQITVMSGHVLGKMAVCTGRGRSAIDGCHPFIPSYIQNDRRELRLSWPRCLARGSISPHLLDHGVLSTYLISQSALRSPEITNQTVKEGTRNEADARDLDGRKVW